MVLPYQMNLFGRQSVRGAEPGLVFAADPRKRTVGADDEVRFAHLPHRRDLGVEAQLHAELLDVAEQERQQLEAADRREAVAGDRDRRVVVDDGDVGPRLQVRRQVPVQRLVVGPEELERAVGEHHAETPGRVARVALEDRDVVRRVEALHQRREVQARGARAEDPDLHGSVTR